MMTAFLSIAALFALVIAVALLVALIDARRDQANQYAGRHRERGAGNPTPAYRYPDFRGWFDESARAHARRVAALGVA